MSSVFKKWISIALAIVLVLSYVPLGAAFAEVQNVWDDTNDYIELEIESIKPTDDVEIQGTLEEGLVLELGKDYIVQYKLTHLTKKGAFGNVGKVVVNGKNLGNPLIRKGDVYGGTLTFTASDSGEFEVASTIEYKYSHDTVIKKITYELVEYVTVTFEAYDENGNAIGNLSNQSFKVKKGNTVEAPEDPSLEGYEFIGWYDDEGNKFDSETTVSKNITWRAKFEQITHQVHFALDGLNFDYQFDESNGSCINVAHGNTIKTHCDNNNLQNLYQALLKGPSKDSDGQYQYEFKGWKATAPMLAVAPQSTLRMPAQDQTEEEDEIISLDSYKVTEDVQLIPVYTEKPAQTPEEPPTEENIKTETAKFYFATIMDDTISDSNYVTSVEAFYPLNVENKTQLVGEIKGTKTDLGAIEYGVAHLTGTALNKYTYVYDGKNLSSSPSKDDFLAAFDSIKDQEIEFKQGESIVKLKLRDPEVGIKLMRVSRQKTLGGQNINDEYVVHVDLRITREKAKDISVSYYLDGTAISEFNNDEGILSEAELDSLKGKSKSGKYGTQYNIPIPELEAFKLQKVTKDGTDLLKNEEGNYAVLFDSELHEIKVYFVSKQEYTVNFELNEGNMPQEDQQIASQEVYEGGKAVKPDTDPVREGHRFGGWFEKEENGELKEAAFDFDNTVINSDITLYAKWTPVENGGGNPGDNPGGDNPGSDNPGDNPGGEENPGGGTPEEGTPEDGTPDGTPEDDTVEVEEEDTPLGTNEDENKDPNKDETVEIDAEETPLGTSEEKTNEDATKETSEVETLLTLEEEGTPLGTAEPNPDSEQVVNLDLEEAVPLGTALPYTGQSSDVPVSVIGGLIVALGIALKKISRR